MGDWALGLFPYGGKWRIWEKALYAHLQPSAVHRYHPDEVKATRQLLCNILDTPQDFLKHIHQCVIYPFTQTIFLNGSHQHDWPD
jgi:hypothetical protein